MAYYLKRKLIDEPYWYSIRPGCSRHEERCKAPYSHNTWPRLEKDNIKVWTHASASQVETFDKCERAWWFKSIKRLPDPQKGHQSLGEAMHRIVEVVPQGGTYVKSDVPGATSEQWDKARKLADQVMKTIPPHITHREAQINLETWEGGPKFIGYIDIGIRPGLGWEQLLIPADPDIGIIGDYKTTSDFKYMKTPAELADSVQMMSYAKWAIQAPGLVKWDENPPNTIYLAHVYALTKDPVSERNVRHSVACVTADQVEAKWNNTLDKIRRMSKIALSPDHNSVEATGALTGHCQAYGGCPFRTQCGLSPVSGIGTLFKVSTKPKTEIDNMSTPGTGSALLERIKAAKAKAASEGGNATETQASPTPSVTHATSPAATATPAGGGGNPPTTGAPVQSVGTHQTPTQSPGHTQVVVPTAPSPAPTTPAQFAVNTGVIPPDAPSRDQPHITTPGQPAPSVVATASSATVSAPSNAAPVVTEGPRRGRPSKAETDAKKAAEDAAFNAKVDAEVEKRLATMGVTMAQGPISVSDEEIAAELTKLMGERDKAQKEADQLRSIRDRVLKERNEFEAKLKAVQDSGVAGVTAQEPEGLTLYVDCLPVKSGEPVLDYYEWQAPIAERAAAMAEVPDWRVVNYTSRGVFAIAMREHIKAHGIPRGAMTLRSTVSGGDIALELLTPLAKRVVTSYR